jgi:hypothetical protein
MAVIPWQRPSPDRRTVTLANTSQIPNALLTADAFGCHLWSVQRHPDSVVLVLSRT